MEIKDSRRLTGLHLLGRAPSAVADVSFRSNEDPERCIKAWLAALNRIRPFFGLETAPTFHRLFEGGASLGFPAPIDQLYAATEINDWAIEAADAQLKGEPEPDLKDAVERIQRDHREEANPAVLALQDAAKKRGLPFLWDDDEVSIGYGIHGQVWPARSAPNTASVQWDALDRIPVTLITGTNGKTTTSRMLTRILKKAEFTVGSTSTDGVCIDEVVIESGDWTGTGAARLALRNQSVNAAVLETARGGLLRRGLAVERCDVAVVTNVAADHLGDYGIQSVEDMAHVKNLVCAAVDSNGYRVINAGDKRLTDLLGQYDSPLILFCIDDLNPIVQSHCNDGGEAWILSEGWIVQRLGSNNHPLMPAKDLPCAFGGAAHHNICNALAASAAASALGISREMIAEGLKGFGAKPGDNPGRCQLIEVQGRRILLDFGHNPHGLEAILSVAKNLLEQRPGSRLCVSLGQAGDRQNQEIIDLADTLSAVHPDRVIAREMTGYERGRGALEVPHLIRDGLCQRGMTMDQIGVVRDEIQALEEAMKWSRPGDLIMLLVHIERSAVADWIEQQSL